MPVTWDDETRGLGHAAPSLYGTPIVSAVAVVSLVLAIGANTAVGRYPGRGIGCSRDWDEPRVVPG
jgi:hypothetical protein